MTHETNTNLVAAILARQNVVSNKLTYTSLHSTYVTVKEATCVFSVQDILSQNPFIFASEELFNTNPTPWFYNGSSLDTIDNEPPVEFYIKSDLETMELIRQAIAEKMQIPIEEIDSDLDVNSQGEPPMHWMPNNRCIAETYSVGYKHRKLEEKMLFDKEKYEAALDLCDQNIASIRESIEVAGNVAEVDSI
jgi:hypothetical protein